MGLHGRLWDSCFLTPTLWHAYFGVSGQPRPLALRGHSLIELGRPPALVEAQPLHRMTAPVMRYRVTRHRVRAWYPPRPIMSASLGLRAPGDRAFVSANSQGVAKLGERSRRTRANRRKWRSHTLPFTGRSPWHLWNVLSRYERGCQAWRGKVLMVPHGAGSDSANWGSLVLPECEISFTSLPAMINPASGAQLAGFFIR